jgi:hypothetical protein
VSTGHRVCGQLLSSDTATSAKAAESWGAFCVGPTQEGERTTAVRHGTVCFLINNKRRLWEGDVFCGAGTSQADIGAPSSCRMLLAPFCAVVQRWGRVRPASGIHGGAVALLRSCGDDAFFNVSNDFVIFRFILLIFEKKIRTILSRYF